MGEYVASQLVKTMIQNDIKIKDAEILALGITFKENCPDIRNTKVVDVIAAFKQYNMKVTIFDPWAKPEEVAHEYSLISQKEIPVKGFDAVLLTVAHQEIKMINLSLLKKNKELSMMSKCFE